MRTMDGGIEADTGETDGTPARFPFPDLIDSAYDRRTAAVVALDGQASVDGGGALSTRRAR